jgi:hypothetical protein
MQRFEGHIRGRDHDLEQGGGWSGGGTPMLFPILQRFDADPHQTGEIALGRLF